MEKKLTNNILLKVCSILAAFLLWMVVINIDNPTDTFIISNIPIKILNEQSALKDHGLTYELPGEKTVSVEVTARRTDRRKISAEDFEATIDMSQIYGATGSVAVNVTVVNNKSLIRSWSQITRSIQVEVEEMQTKEFEIQVIQEGDPAESYTFDSDPVVSPHSVRVTAPKSIMDQIDHAGVKVNIDGKTDNVLAEGEVKLFGAKGQELPITDERVTMNVTTVDISLSVVKTNQVNVDVVVTGQSEVADGCKYITYICEPQTIMVTGAKSLIAEFDKITLEEDLTGASQTITKTYRISDYLKEGLEPAEGQPEVIRVEYQIERLAQKSFRIGKDRVSLRGELDGLSYQIGDDDTVTVVLEGLQEDLDKVTAQDISVTLDLSSVDEAGTYEIEPQIRLEEAYESYFEVKAAPVRLVVTAPEPELPSGSLPESSGEPGSEEQTTEPEETSMGSGEIN